MEPTYEDVDDEGNPYQARWERPAYADTSKAGYKDILERIFSTCGNRKYFGSAREAKDWRLICRKIDRDQIPLGWIESCIAWVTEKNKDRLVITFSAVESLILNSSKMKDWEARNKPLGDLNFVKPEELEVVKTEDRQY